MLMRSFKCCTLLLFALASNPFLLEFLLLLFRLPIQTLSLQLRSLLGFFPRAPFSLDLSLPIPLLLLANLAFPLLLLQFAPQLCPLTSRPQSAVGRLKNAGCHRTPF